MKQTKLCASVLLLTLDRVLSGCLLSGQMCVAGCCWWCFLEVFCLFVVVVVVVVIIVIVVVVVVVVFWGGGFNIHCVL